MSNISRRALFGLSVGAVATGMVKPALAAPVLLQSLHVGEPVAKLIVGRAGEAYAEAVRVGALLQALNSNKPQVAIAAARMIERLDR